MEVGHIVPPLFYTAPSLPLTLIARVCSMGNHGGLRKGQ